MGSISSVQQYGLPHCCTELIDGHCIDLLLGEIDHEAHIPGGGSLDKADLRFFDARSAPVS